MFRLNSGLTVRSESSLTSCYVTGKLLEGVRRGLRSAWGLNLTNSCCTGNKAPLMNFAGGCYNRPFTSTFFRAAERTSKVNRRVGSAGAHVRDLWSLPSSLDMQPKGLFDPLVATFSIKMFFMLDIFAKKSHKLKKCSRKAKWWKQREH